MGGVDKKDQMLEPYLLERKKKQTVVQEDVQADAERLSQQQSCSFRQVY